MTEFWVLAGVMLVLSVLIISIPILRKQTALVSTEADQANIDIARAQLKELEADVELGRIDQSQFDQAKQELEVALLNDISGSAGPSTASSHRGRWIMVFIVPAIPLLAVSLYQMIGTAQIIPAMANAPKAAPAEVVSADQMPEKLPSVDEMVASLAARMKAAPDDLKGWVLLARSYALMGRHADSIEAFENILRLGGGTPDILSSYADALIMVNGGRFSTNVMQLLDKALEIDPEHVQSLWLLGHAASENAQWETAIGYWQRAEKGLSPDGQDYQVIENQIAEAQRRLSGVEPIVADAEPSVQIKNDNATISESDKLGSGAISVSVSLDPALSATANPEDTVFIFARASQGPRMPLAIVRKQVKDLPVTVTLDDSQAMSSAMVMSAFSQVNIGARVSASGQAMPQSGDLQGEVLNLKPGTTNTVTLVIDSRRP